MLWPMRIFENQVHAGHIGLPMGPTLKNESCRTSRYTLGGTFIFGSFLGIGNHPFWYPNFSPPCGQLAAPYLYTHDEDGLNFRSCN